MNPEGVRNAKIRMTRDHLAFDMKAVTGFQREYRLFFIQKVIIRFVIDFYFVDIKTTIGIIDVVGNGVRLPNHRIEKS